MKQMKKMMVILALLASACSTVKRYGSVDTPQKEKPLFLPADQDESGLRVRMDISDSRISEPGPSGSYKSLWDLQNDGQKALLGILAERYKDNDKFTDVLNSQYLSDDGGGGGAIDYTRKNVRIVFSISRWHPYDLIKGGVDGFSLADRIEYLKYKLTLDDSGSTIKFTGWNRYSTAYGSINIADVSFQESLSASAGEGGGPGGGINPGAGASVSASKSKIENQKVRYRYVQLNGNIGKKYIQLESEGTREVDLAGNVMADVTMEFDAFPEVLYTLSKPKNDSGYFLPPDQVHLNESVALVPGETTIHDICAILTYDYAYRHVEKGSDTYYEWDDKVKYVTGTVSKKVTLMKAKDIVPPFCCLKFQSDHSNNGKNFIKIRNLAAGLGAQETNLAFPNQQSASAFITWLVSYKCPAGSLNEPIKLKNGYALWYNGAFLTRQKILDNNDQMAEVFQYDIQK